MSDDITVGPPHIKGWNNLVQGWSVGGISSGADVEINEVLSGIDLGIFPATNHIILWGTVSAEAKVPDVAVQTYDGKWHCATQEDGKLRCRFDGRPLRIGHHEIRAEIIFPVTDESDAEAVQIQLTKSDIFRAHWLNSIRRPVFWLIPAVFAVATYNVWSPVRYGWLLALFACSFIVFLMPFMSTRTTTKNPDVITPITLGFSEAGITAQYRNATNSAAWSLVKGARETETFIFIEMQRGSFHLIPKRQLNQEQATRVRRILRSQISRNVHISN